MAVARIGVALGSGGARGLAHIPYIEALDELGLAPSLIAGTSIGALIGAGWASGMSGAALRAHAEQVNTLQESAGRLWTRNRPHFSTLRDAGVSMQVDALNIVDAYLPEAFPLDFASLPIAFNAVATDYFKWEPVVFSSGELRPALAASLAIPGLFRPLRSGPHLYIDGGASNPLPLEQAKVGVDVVIAIDVNGMPDDPAIETDPSFLDVSFRATQIMTQSMIRQALTLHPPDIYVHAPVRGFRVLEFWRAREIIAQAEADKDAFKRSVEAAVEAASRRAR